MGEDMSEQQRNVSSGKKKLWIGMGAAIAAAAAVLILFVLPAERGVDPTGVGAAAGLVDLSRAGKMTELERGALRTGVLTLKDESLRTERRELVLEPMSSVEYKYVLSEGAPLVFSWQAGDTVHYDLHAHPFEGGTALTESYGVGDARGQTGLYVAAFSGIHGWYWENRTLEPVKVVLNATGHFTETILSSRQGETKTPAPPVH